MATSPHGLILQEWTGYAAQSGAALVPREAELQQPLRSADLRAALPVMCLVKYFDVAISMISLSPPALRAPKPPWL